MNRKLWSNCSFTLARPAQWPCPRCDRGILVLRNDSLKHEETNASKANHDHEDWDPSSIYMAFSAFFVCDSCYEPIGVAGWGNVNEKLRQLPDGSVDDYTEDEFYPEFFTIAPKLIDIPIDCNTEVEIEIEKSFQLFFVDHNSCGNKIRSSIELMLDEFGIQKRKRITRSSGKKEVRSMTLHDRIIKFGLKNPKPAERLLAIKWIGNFGSHGQELQKADLLDAYEIYEIALAEIYDVDKTRVDKLTKNINKRRGPLNPAKRRSR